MKIADKELSFYWKAVQLPFFLLAGWSVLSLIIILISEDLYVDIFMNPWVTNSVPISLFLLCGYLAVVEYNQSGRESAWTGALVGFCAGIVTIIVSVIMITSTGFMDLLSTQAFAQIAETGQVVDPEMMKNMIKLTMTIGVVITPLTNALMGALFSWLGGLVGRKIEG
jgi:hypothetical protein